MCKIIGLGQNKISCDITFILWLTRFLWCSGYHFWLLPGSVLVWFWAKAHLLSSLILCSKKSTKSNLPRKNITCTSKLRLHSSSAIKKSTKSNFPRKNVTCTLKMHLHFSSAAKKYKIKFTQKEYHMYIKNVSSLFLCSKKSTKSNLPRMNITCTLE